MSGLERFKSRRTEGKPRAAVSTRKARQKEFTTMELAPTAAAAKAAGCPGAAVLVVLRYLAWKAASPTFPVPNTMFTRYDISRHVKYRVLANLEKAGWIQIERRGTKASPRITLLKPLG